MLFALAASRGEGEFFQGTKAAILRIIVRGPEDRLMSDSEGMLVGKTALVTGAGGGIGLAIVRRLAAQGADIVVADASEAIAQRAVSAVETAGRRAISLPGDLTSQSYCDTLPEKAFEAGGRLDILVNNAGVMRRGNILSASDDDWDLSMKINVEAVFRLCRSTIGLMAGSGGGTIVNVASCWGLYPGPDHLVYCTSKAALAAMTRCLGRDHARDGIRVNAVCPNEVNTPMLKTGFAQRGLDPERAIDQLNDSVPLGRIAEPEDIADVVCFLASDQSRYVCGACVEVNGAKPVY